MAFLFSIFLSHVKKRENIYIVRYFRNKQIGFQSACLDDNFPDLYECFAFYFFLSFTTDIYSYTSQSGAPPAVDVIFTFVLNYLELAMFVGERISFLALSSHQH